jgi:hypothetical protein
VRRAEAQALGAARLEELGRRVGDDGEAVRILLNSETRALPLGALYLLKRGEAERLAIERIPQPDPRLLLASTFNFFVRTPARMTGQLDACSRVATQVPMFWAHVPADLSAAELAEAVAAHADGEAEPQ